MLRNHLKVAIRNLLGQKIYSTINLFGLALGTASALLIFLWVQDELSYDQFHKNKADIYRILSETQTPGQAVLSAITPNALGPELEQDYPEVRRAARYLGGYSGWLLKYGDQMYRNDRWAAVDPAFFKMFSFPVMAGDPALALEDRGTIVITEELARKYFGEQEAIGKTIRREGTDLKVGAVITIPENSHLQFDYAVAIANMEQWWYQDLQSWQPGPFKTYVQLAPGSSLKLFEKKITNAGKGHTTDLQLSFQLQPLTEIHLRTDFEDNGNYKQGDITYVYIFALIAVSVFVIACINFINLTLARAVGRGLEVGVRKVVGARRVDIFNRFLGEALLLSFCALTVSVGIAELCLPAFNDLTSKKLTIVFGSYSEIMFPLLGFGLVMALLAGGYPALYLSRFRPVHIMKRTQSSKGKAPQHLRKTLVLAQFVVAIVLIAATSVVYQQLRYLQTKDVGYDSEHIIYFHAAGQFSQDYESIRARLLQSPHIRQVSRAFPPFFPATLASGNITWQGKQAGDDLVLNVRTVDYDFAEIFGLEMSSGRFFSKEHISDPGNYVINETAARLMALDKPIGKALTYDGRKGKIIGVIKDYHQSSMHSKIAPTIFQIFDYAPFICVKLAAGNPQQALAFVEQQWQTLVADQPFVYYFFEDYLSRLYVNEERIATAAKYFTLLTLSISCLGLFGLATFAVNNRRKEFGIRKVVGASMASLMFMMSKEFVTWVLLANLIAWPIAWHFMDKWLQTFAYRINIGVETFLTSAGLSLSLTLLTIVWQLVKCASTNPVEALRYE